MPALDKQSRIHNDADHAKAAHRQRSLLKTLWSEATSTTDLAPPLNHRLHQRHSATTAAGTGSSPSKHSRKGSSGSATSVASASRRRSGRRAYPRYRVRRADRIAKRVWLSAFAAFAASIIIAVHIFLFRGFIGSADSHSDSEGLEGNLKNGRKIMAVEDHEVKMTLAEAHSHQLASIKLHSIDISQYTIRINSWQRNEQLLLSVNHHAQCEGVKEIQIIWCDSANNPPDEIVHHTSGKVKIEHHVINSLNERFKVMIDPPTLGILSLDDDVLRPCAALDAAFLRWTRHPERMVGFDARTHVVVEGENTERLRGSTKSNWKYGYMSTTESSNHYSMTLPRASFLHRDYLDLYNLALPRPIYIYIAQHLECEDIAMSFFVSSLTSGKPPLLADYWAVKSMIKLYSSKTISGGKGHKLARDACVDDFAELLGVKENGEWPLQTDNLLHQNSFFGYGAEPEDWRTLDPKAFETTRLQGVINTMQELQAWPMKQQRAWLMKQKAQTTKEAKAAGMIENTEEWKTRWNKN